MATAALLPLPRQVFYDPNGAPLSAGYCYTYVPGGTTPATTWQDAAETTPNANPIVLDANGSALIYGNGNYQITVTDSLGNQVPAYSGLSASPLSGSTFAPYIATVAALRAVTTATVPQSQVTVGGYYAAADGGGGGFVIGANASDNGGTIINDASGRSWYRLTLGAPLNAAWFGVIASQVDNTSALTSALAALTVSGELWIPAGTYQFLNQVTWTFPVGAFSGTICGAGTEATILNWASGGGLLVELSNAEHSAHVRDMTFSTSALGVGAGVALYNTTAASPTQQSDVTRVTFRGSDGGAQTYYWLVGIDSIAVGSLNYVGCMFFGPSGGANGVGAQMAGISAGSIYSRNHNFQSCTFNDLGIGINQGTNVTGLSVSQCNFTGGTVGINLPSTSANAAQIAVTASQFGVSGNAIALHAACAALLAQGNLIYVLANEAGIDCLGLLTESTITGNAFTTTSNTASFGVVNNTTVNACLIVGNSFTGFAAGISLGSSSAGWNVQSNTYYGCTTNVSNSGTNTVGGGSS
jgi:hypothetical protein